MTASSAVKAPEKIIKGNQIQRRRRRPALIALHAFSKLTKSRTVFSGYLCFHTPVYWTMKAGAVFSPALTAAMKEPHGGAADDV